MNKLLNLVAVAFLVGLAGYFVSNHGTTWRIGRYGMPASLVAADGVMHPDGSGIDPVTLTLVKADREEETELAALAVLVLVVVVLFWQAWKLACLRQKVLERRIRDGSAHPAAR